MKFITFLFFNLILSNVAWAQSITESDLRLDDQSLYGEMFYSNEVVISNEVIKTVEIEVTSKGNGSMKIGNLYLKVYDTHDDGDFYEGHMLKIEFIDINKDGYKDIILTGIRCKTEEKGNLVVQREGVFLIFLYDFQSDHFVKSYSSEPCLDELSKEEQEK